MSQNASKKVVIIGGGPSAKHASEILVKRKDVVVTLVQANQFVEWPLAMAVALISPDLHGKALAPNASTFEVPGVTYKYGVVESVETTSKHVILVGKEMVPYDVLIVATGFKMPCLYPDLGVSLKDRKAEVQNIGNAIKNAKCIVVAGGGPVGLEIVGNIRVKYPDASKKVLLVSRSKVASFLAEDKRLKVEAQLRKMNVEIVVGADAAAPTNYSLEPGTLKVGGKQFTYNVYLPVFNQGPNTKFLMTNLLDEKQRVKVNGYLQSEVSPEVFAIGVSNREESFVGFAKLEAQWKSATANVSALLDGKPLKLHKEGVPFMKGPPLVVIGHGPTGYGIVDFDSLPPPCKVCCCCGYGGFPFCPPCWPCCACGGCGCCPCGYCGGPPEGSGPSKFAGKMAFMSSGFHFKGVGEVEVAPKQLAMTQ